MPQKYHGTIDELKSAVAATGIKGEWKSDGTGKHSFRSVAGGILNWWESKGTLQFQGNDEAKTILELSLDGAMSGSAAGSAARRGPVTCLKKECRIYKTEKPFTQNDLQDPRFACFRLPDLKGSASV